MSDNNKLKPCPFCGGGAVKYKTKHGVVAGCISDACPAERWSLPLQTWNTRHETTKADKTEAELAEIMNCAYSKSKGLTFKACAKDVLRALIECGAIRVKV